MKKWMVLWGGLFAMMTLAGCGSPKVKIVEMSEDKLVSPGPVILESEEADLNRIVTFTVIGKGIEPETALTKGQAVLMAERAAVSDGYRQFVEKLRGVYIDAFSKVGYGMVDQDYVNACARSMLRGVEVKEVTHGQYGIAQAVMTLRIKFTHQGMIWWPEGLGRMVNIADNASFEGGAKGQRPLPEF